MLQASLQTLRATLNETILGSERAADLLLTALLARGHALVTGPPGIGKTSLASTLAMSLGGMFKRLQFTPDLLPSDIIGWAGFSVARHRSGLRIGGHSEYGSPPGRCVFASRNGRIGAEVGSR